MVERIGAVSERLIVRGVNAAAQKAVSHQLEIKCCGHVYAGTAAVQNPQRIQVLVNLRSSSTRGEFMHFLHAMNWRRCALADFATLEAALQ